MCDRIEAEAIAWVEAQMAEGSVDLLRDRVLLIVHPDWHHGVIGIVASRLVERYGVPVFICTYEDKAQKEIRGSARGIPEFQVFEALQSCHDLLTKFGGHKAAGGFSFPTKHLRQVKSRLVNFANQTLLPEHLKPLVTVDVRASLDQLTFALHEQIDQLHPCGIGNPDPVFWTPNVRVVEQRAIGQTKAHLKLVVADEANHTLEAIAWRWGSYCPLPERLDIAYKLKLNEWQGNTTIQLELVGVKPPSQPRSQPSSPAPQATAAPTHAASLHLPLASNGSVAPSPPTAQPPEMQSSTTAASPPRAATIRSTAVSPANPVADPITRADFYFSHRRYQACTVQTGDSRQLEIQNPEGQVFVVSLRDRQGYLCLPGEPARPVDLSEPHYFNLLRAGLDALEIRQQTHLLIAKDELLADKDQHIATLTQQLELLQAQVSQFSSSEKQQFQELQAAVKAQASAMQKQEAHIETLKQQMHRPPPTVDPKAIKRAVREAVGDKIWYCLQPQSQKDLYAAYKHVALTAADGSEEPSADYSEAGVRLGLVVEREVVSPYLDDLYAFLQSTGRSEIGGVSLGKGRPAALGKVAALLATAWTSLRSPALNTPQPPPPDQLYDTVKARQRLSQGDRTLLAEFLEQWEHPMSRWFQTAPEEVAAYVDQIGQFRDRAAQASAPLYLWAFEHMRNLIVGGGQTPGLFNQIYLNG